MKNGFIQQGARSPSPVEKGLEGRCLHVLDRAVSFGGNTRTVLEFGRRVDDFTVSPRNLHGDWSKRRLHRRCLAIEALPFHFDIAHTDGGALSEHDGREALASL